ncbi:hypothetical protein ACFY4B_27470 [Kitasatospora sp. NPDC001261]|uniref:hypothetical protein n=1 Tax=Kitasatospora sp. NPDC001261 TaxID=3364012 RepID=UPI0036AAE2F5
MTTATPAAPTVHAIRIGTVPLYGAVCDLCPAWLGPTTTDQDEHVQHVRSHAWQHPEPPTRPVEEWGTPAPVPATRGEIVGQLPMYRVTCPECPTYQGLGSTDRDTVARYVEAHAAVHRAHAEMQANRFDSNAIRAHRAAVRADPGRWDASAIRW